MATLNIKKFPDGLYQELKELADQENRSISQEVIHILQQAVRGRGKRSLLELQGLGKMAWEGTDVPASIENERNEWDRREP
jgi:plasmid stability protein